MVTKLGLPFWGLHSLSTLPPPRSCHGVCSQLTPEREAQSCCACWEEPKRIVMQSPPQNCMLRAFTMVSCSCLMTPAQARLQSSGPSGSGSIHLSSIALCHAPSEHFYTTHFYFYLYTSALTGCPFHSAFP